MTLLASRSNRLNAVLAHEYAADFGFCRKSVSVAVESGMDVGAVLAYSLVSGSATATAGTNTGNGTVGTITVGKHAKVGTYKLTFTGAATNAGGYRVADPTGVIVGAASVGAVCTTVDGLSFTVNDGSVDFVVGDSFSIVVTGTERYEWVEAADVATLNRDVVVLIETDKDVPSLTAGANTLTVMHRGPAGVKNAGLVYKDSLNAAQKALVQAALEAKGIAVRTAV